MDGVRNAWESLLAHLPGPLAMSLRRAAWGLARPILLLRDRMRRDSRRANRVELVLFAWGVGAEAIERAVETTGAPPSQVLVVTDSPAFAPLRSTGHPVEYVIAPAELEQQLPDVDQPRTLERRVRGLLDSYPHDAVAVAGTPPEGLLNLLGTLAADVRKLDGT
jgi:hypothetical protein